MKRLLLLSVLMLGLAFAQDQSLEDYYISLIGKRIENPDDYDYVSSKIGELERVAYRKYLGNDLSVEIWSKKGIVNEVVIDQLNLPLTETSMKDSIGVGIEKYGEPVDRFSMEGSAAVMAEFKVSGEIYNRLFHLHQLNKKKGTYRSIKKYSVVDW